MTKLFLSYARGDDEPFVRKLCDGLTVRGFDIWFDRISMPSRNLTFHQEIRDAIAARDRLVLVIGPRAAKSDYVRQEWQFAWFEAEKVVTPILRLGDFSHVPDELKLLHCEDFRDDEQFAPHLEQLVRILREPPSPLGKLIAVPSLPAHFLSRSEDLTRLRDDLRADLDRPVIIGGAAARVGLHGMGGIGKSVQAAALARDRKVREAFPDGIVWIGLGAMPELLARMQDVHLALGGDGAIATEYEGKEKLRALLKDKAVLLVIDDVWRRGDVDAFDILGSRCRTLITTRDAGLLTSLGGTHHIVELLTDAEALRLLVVAAGVESHVLPADAREVLSECGRLPLAVALVGGMVRAGTPWRDIRDALREHELEFLEDPHAASEQHVNLWRAIEVSVQALAEDAQQRLTELAGFPEEEPVPEAAVATLWQHTGNLSPRHSRRLLAELKQRSLVQLTRSVETAADVVGKVSLHDLIHDYCVRRSQKQFGSETALHTRLLNAYRRTCPGGWWSGPNDGYFLDHLRNHLVATGRGGELVDLLHEPRWLEVKLAAGLGNDLLKDFACAQAAATAAVDLPASDRAAADRCALVGRLLGNVIDVVRVEPSSVTAQLLLELSELSPQQLPAFRPRWEVANRNRPWFERHSVTRRYTIPYVAQTGQRQVYLHSLTFSADSQSLLYFDWDGSVVRWDWKASDQSRTKAPTQGGFVRGAAVPAEREVLLTDETTLWLLRVPKLWHGELAAGVWRVLYRAEPGHHLRALAACPERGYAVFVEEGGTQGRLLRFRTGAERCEPAWRLPHAGGGLLTNHIAFGDGGALRAVCFGSGDLAVNTGFHGRAHHGGVYEAVFLTGRGLLASVGDDGTLALWDVRRGLVLRRDLTLGAADCVDYCAAADLLAVGHRTGAVTLLQFDGDDLREEVLHPGVRGWVLCVRFSPCGRYLAVGGRNGVVRLFIVSQVLDELRRHKDLFLNIPQGPVEQAACVFPTRVGYFLDQSEHLYSTGASADSQHLPQKCETFCVGPQKGPVVLLPEDIRFLDPFSGRPRHIHRLSESSRLASALSPREDMLAVLEPARLVVYALDDPAAPPREICAVALGALRAAVGVAFPTQRNAVPLCFCDDGRTIALPLEPISRTRKSTDGTFSNPPLEHRLCLIEVATGQLLWVIPYQGFCTALAEIRSQRALAVGMGTKRVYMFDATDRQPQGSYFLPSNDPGVVLLALADGQVLGRLPLPAADDGVSTLSSDTRGLLLVGCRSGRVRAASLDENHWLASVVLPAPVLGFAHQGSALHCHAIDDGSTVGNWPVIHELLLWLPREPLGTQLSGGQ